MANTVLNAVYNHYLTAYAPKSMTRYDAHKKSELRGVYNSIVKLNKESPWYLPTNVQDIQSFAIGLKENARELQNTIASLGGLDEAGLLSKKTAFSSDEEVASASFIGTYTPGETAPSFTLEIENLAANQENMGHFLAGGKIGLEPDTYSFDVMINDMNYEFQFSIGESETNRDVQERLARLISTSGIGIKASVQEAEGRTSLVLQSEAAGRAEDRESIFSVSDTHTSKRQGAVNYFGLDYVSREAQNAHFLVNGERRSSSSNSFTVSKLFEIHLNGASPEGKPVTIGLKTDMESLKDNVIQLADGYNRFLKAASGYLESQPRSKHVLRDMSNIAGKYREAFSGMGVTLGDNGMLSVNKERLGSTILSSDDLSNTFGTFKDFSDQLLKKSREISINPMNYVDKKIVAYKNPGHNYANPYVTSAYSGMMFNSYC